MTPIERVCNEVMGGVIGLNVTDELLLKIEQHLTNYSGGTAHCHRAMNPESRTKSGRIRAEIWISGKRFSAELSPAIRKVSVVQTASSN